MLAMIPIVSPTTPLTTATPSPALHLLPPHLWHGRGSGEGAGGGDEGQVEMEGALEETIAELKGKVGFQRKDTFSIPFPSLCWETCTLSSLPVILPMILVFYPLSSGKDAGEIRSHFH